MKRVWAYYRVSTKSQVLQHDITLQRKACLEYVSNLQNCIIEREIEELAVSGYSKTIEKREGLNRILLGAKQKEFDVLLVFMLDRIGRKKEEMEFFFDTFKAAEVEIWSVIDGKFSGFSNDEMKYFDQSSKEVEKTSQRVKKRFAQLKEEGSFTGGSAPYGYKLVKVNGISELVINPTEADVVNKIFNLACINQFGSCKITQVLNNQKIKTRHGKQWIYTTITRILRNPVYIGFPAFNKYSNLNGRHKRSEWKPQPKNEKLIIVDEKIFSETQKLMDKRIPHNNYSGVTPKEEFLLNDLCFCGYCGKKLKSEINRGRPKSLNRNNIDAKIYRRYVCDYSKNHHILHNQRDFGAEKHEELVISSLQKLIESNNIIIDNTNLIRDKGFITEKIDKLKEELKLMYSLYFMMKNAKELSKINKVENDIHDLNIELFHLDNRLCNLLSKEQSFNFLKYELINWNKRFEECNIIEKWVMIERIVEKVILEKEGYTIITKDYIKSPANFRVVK
ncbi:recombinase family protein [Bacillus sp. DNRA2]|uniref:recombinase family protein n=1 Tax=Bacillus sp. DNRA2 TaxID=2723053 RepID=UPI00145EC67A|nr:recombinase family protein [Bacillus sp. DNRA2]